MIYVRDRPMLVQESLRETNWRWFPCTRCGIRKAVRVKRRNYICLDCRQADPDYVKMVRTKREVA